MKKASGINYEIWLAFGIEPILYGTLINEWTDLQTIFHWVMTCILWGAASLCIIQFAKKKFDFDIFQKGNKMAVWQFFSTYIIF